MATRDVTPVSLRIPQDLMAQLMAHLFPGDGDEHGAVIAASVLTTARGTRLLAHRAFLAEDGIDYVPGRFGYRALTAEFVMDCALECDDLGMAYLAVHCHGGTTSVEFSDTDMQSHERGYPALLDLLGGPPVGALVFAEHAVAGDIWFPDRTRSPLEVLVVPGTTIQELWPRRERPPAGADERYDRQARLFGDRGQRLLARQKVGVIGLGGAGSLIVEQLAHLGVGSLVLIDPDRIEATNLSRVVGSTPADVRARNSPSLPARWLSRLGAKPLLKTAISRRLVARITNNAVGVKTVPLSVIEPAAADELLDCDFVFLAADSMQARLVFNAIVHQYLIPGVQMGTKARVQASTGNLTELYVAHRPVIPGAGCLWCNNLIPPDRLQAEATAPDQLRRQRYVDDDEVAAPSVITLNAIAAALSVNGMLMSLTGLQVRDDLVWTRYEPQTIDFYEEAPTRDPECPYCGAAGRLGRGPTQRLPIAVTTKTKEPYRVLRLRQR